MKFLLLLALVVAAIIIGLAVVAAIAGARKVNAARQSIQASQNNKIETAYKPDDLAWLYAQGVDVKEIQRIAEQNRLTK